MNIMHLVLYQVDISSLLGWLAVVLQHYLSSYTDVKLKLKLFLLGSMREFLPIWEKFSPPSDLEFVSIEIKSGLP